MKKYYKRYFFLAVTGAAIIGLAFYLLLNNYLDREAILVAAKDIEAGTIISIDDLGYCEFYKNSLPENYLLSGEDIIDKTIGVERRKGDYISIDMLDHEIKENDLFHFLEDGKVIISVRVQHPEPLLQELKNGDIVSIVSTIRDQDFLQPSLSPVPTIIEKHVNEQFPGFDNISLQQNDYINTNTFELSKNILSIDGQIIIRNLQIADMQKSIEENNSNILINNDTNSIDLYFICELEEAPLIARLTADSKYKIIYERL